jgi:hypothetical protein
MRRIKIAGLCLVATMAVGTTITSSASAAPEYFKTGGVITKSYAFTLSSTGPIRIGTSIYSPECSSESGKGYISPPNRTVRLKLSYEGCTVIQKGEPISCQTSATKPGIIKTKTLTGILVLASEVIGGPTTITNHIEPEGGGFNTYLKYKCTAKQGRIQDGVLGSLLVYVHPIGVETSTSEWSSELKEFETEEECTRQRFLYIDATGPCKHWFYNTKELVANETVTYKLKAGEGIEVHP